MIIFSRKFLRMAYEFLLHKKIIDLNHTTIYLAPNPVDQQFESGS